MKEILPDHPYKIVICHRNEKYESYIFDLIKNKIKNVEITRFKTTENLKDVKCNLIITDVDFKSNKFDCLQNLIVNHHNQDISYLVFTPSNLEKSIMLNSSSKRM